MALGRGFSFPAMKTASQGAETAGSAAESRQKRAPAPVLNRRPGLLRRYPGSTTRRTPFASLLFSNRQPPAYSFWQQWIACLLRVPSTAMPGMSTPSNPRAPLVRRAPNRFRCVSNIPSTYSSLPNTKPSEKYRFRHRGAQFRGQTLHFDHFWGQTL